MSATVKSSMTGGKRRGAFTLLELLVAMGVIIILAMLLLGAMIRARSQARDANCKNNLSQLWKCINLYANNHRDLVFVNTVIPLQISNVIYKDKTISGLGFLYSNFLPDYRTLFCPSDPVRDPEWTYGLDNWLTEEGEVRVSYGYRGRQGFTLDPDANLNLGVLDKNPTKVLICDFYGGPTAPPKHHHEWHINVVRCSGAVEAIRELPRIGHDLATAQEALDLLDR